MQANSRRGTKNSDDWPLLFVALSQAAIQDPGGDWSLCADGKKHRGAVKAAVNEFAERNGLTVFVTYGDAPWPTWIIWKL